MRPVAGWALLLLIVGMAGRPVAAQLPSLSGWRVEVLDILPAGTESEITSLTMAEQFLAGTTGDLEYAIEAVGTRLVDALDLAGEPGSYDVNVPYPHGFANSAGDHFIVRATAEVFIPAGFWSVAIGGYEGVQLSIDGVNLDDPLFRRWGGHGPDGNGQDAVNRVRREQAPASGGYGFTGGHFTVGQNGLSTTITALMYGSAGPDALEVVVRDNSDFLFNQRPQDNLGLDPNFDALWQPLADGVFGWQVRNSEFENLVAIGGLQNQGVHRLPTGANLLDDTVYEFEIDADGLTGDRLEINGGSGALNVGNATLRVNVTGEPQEGAVFQLVNAGSITGQPVFEFSNGNSGWDTSKFATTGTVVFTPSAPTLPGDTDGDGDVDTADLTTMITNWTGALDAGVGGRGIAHGDTDGDQDVDTSDMTTMLVNWTGSQQAGPMIDSGAADLIYDPATGEVCIDASDTPSGKVISFVLINESGQFRPVDDTRLPFPITPVNTDNKPQQIGQADLTFQGAPSFCLGPIFPPGMDAAELDEFLATASYAYAPGGGGDLDILLVPEPSAGVLALGFLGLIAGPLRRRRRVEARSRLRPGSQFGLWRLPAGAIAHSSS